MHPPIRNRISAGKELAEALQSYQGLDNVIVLGLPRGGVPVAFEIAKKLKAPLDLMLVRKLGVPSYRELAMGAIASGDIKVLNPQVIHSYGISEAQIEEVEKREREELDRRAVAYRGQRPYPDLNDKIVIIVDDGLATGATMHAAIDAVHLQNPRSIVIAIPVAPPESISALRQKVDEVICPLQPTELSSIGQWYEDFSQVSDEDVTELLSQVWQNE
ncbi:MAG: phosphoribosyltransferase [Sulfurovum sp.]|nr:phosphoribosyltransferase [Sulfurovum sp.]